MTLDKFSAYFHGFEWPWYMPTTTEYESIVKHSGLQNAKVWGENADRYFPDTQSMVNWVDQPSIVPFLSNVADVDKIEFRDFVVRRMVEETVQEDGRCFETFRESMSSPKDSACPTRWKRQTLKPLAEWRKWWKSFRWTDPGT